MRKINLGDTFKMARIIKDGNLIESIKRSFAEGKTSEDATEKEKEDKQEQIGINLIMDIFAACANDKVEEQVYDLLAGITEKKKEDIQNQSLDTTLEEISKIAEENNIVNFLKSAFGAAQRLSN